VHVRRALRGDAAAIADVHVRTWQTAYEHVFGPERLAGIDVSRRASGWARGLADGEIAFVAEEDGRLVGFASVGPARDLEGLGELYAIYVLPEAWGTGAGPGLMRAAVGELRAAGYADAVLWVLEDNPRARRFYEREGWEHDGSVKEDEFLGLRVPEVRYRIRLA
jgi:GNAT superfamily N-acetyltransferase